jgi:hypothetical protein
MKRFLCLVSLCFVLVSITAQEQKPDLWIFALGINHYKNLNTKANLRWAIPNTREIINVFTAQQGRAFNTIHSFIITDGSEYLPVYNTIIANLEFVKRAKPSDVVLFYFSGHGEADRNGVFNMLASDAGFYANGGADFTNAISMDVLRTALNIPAKKIIMFDSCYSEAAIKTLRSPNTVIFTSSREAEESLESKYLLGAFSLAVSEGLSGKAAENGVVTAGSLEKYIGGRITQIASEMGHEQHPVAYIPEQLRGFVLGRY